jgi:hypothetical protein
MIIDRFGDDYETAYPLPQGLFVDEWAATRPPVTARAGQMSGAVDFFGADAYPLGPLIVKKKMMLVGSSWANVDTLIDDLIDSTIMTEFESKLWGLQSDGTTTVWCYAKCTRLQIEEKATNPTTGVPVSIEFFCREGVWYGGSESAQQYATDGTKTVQNAGAVAAHLRFALQNADVPDNPTIFSITVYNNTNDDTWTFDAIPPDNPLPLDTELIVDSATQTCTLNGAAAYSGLTVGDYPGGGGQTYWLRLEPGENSITISITPDSGIFTYTLTYIPTY